LYIAIKQDFAVYAKRRQRLLFSTVTAWNLQSTYTQVILKMTQFPVLKYTSTYEVYTVH